MINKKDNRINSSMVQSVLAINPFCKLTDIVADIIEAKIVNLDFVPGEKLNLSRIATSLNVSFSPVREAMELLVQKGLIKAVETEGEGRKNFYILNPSSKDISDIFEARRAIEGYSAFYCALRNWNVPIKELQESINDFKKAVEAFADGENNTSAVESSGHFHEIIVKATHNKLYWNMYQSIHTNTKYLSYLTCEKTVAHGIDSLRVLVNQHQAILYAIKHALPEVAKQAMESHVDYCAQHFYKAQYDRYGR
jgi:DNA-binding GntR family transcriptional regulator